MIEEFPDVSIEPPRGMVITDFDGTIHSHETGVTDRDRKTLESLKDKGILRVIATGRSPYSVDKAIDESFPVDYVIFSSGAGVMRLEGRRIIRRSFFTEDEVSLICRKLKALSCDFMVFKPIPMNHYFFYHRSQDENPDFDRRLEIYDGCSVALPERIGFKAAQFLCIEPFDVSRYETIRSEFPGCNVIRATSPIDGESIWVEIFPKGVNKGEASDWLSRKAMVSRDNCLVLGNDYNDIDMLSWACSARVVGNAPDDIKRMFPSVAPQSESGFSEAVESWLASRGISLSET